MTKLFSLSQNCFVLFRTLIRLSAKPVPAPSFAFPISKTIFCIFCNSTLLWLSGKPVRTHPLHCLPPAFTCCTAYMHLPFLRIKYLVLICTQYTVEFAYMHTMYCLYICILLYCIISICTQCTAHIICDILHSMYYVLHVYTYINAHDVLRSM